MKMRKAFVAFLAVICIFASFSFLGTSAEGERRVYAETSPSVSCGSYGYCYVYIDGLESLASLNVELY